MKVYIVRYKWINVIKIGLILVGLLIISPLTVYAKDITAFVHIDKDADFKLFEHNAWYTADGEHDSVWHIVAGKYSSGWYHDMIEWVYPDESWKGPIYDPIVDELTVPDDASEICYQDSGDYKSCTEIATEVHFSYP